MKEKILWKKKKKRTGMGPRPLCRLVWHKLSEWPYAVLGRIAARALDFSETTVTQGHERSSSSQGARCSL